MNELMLYSSLDEQVAAYFIQYLNWINDNTVYTARFYSPGGDVLASWGIPAKMNELKSKGCRSIAKVDGMAASMAGVLLAYFDEREALDVSQIMIHRAAYPERDHEGNKIEISPEEKIQLTKINSDLKQKLSQVINDNVLKNIKGYGLDELFDENKPRINCWLTAEEAFQIGLVTKVVRVDADTSKYMVKAVASCYDPTQKPKVTATSAGLIKKAKMTAEEIKEKFPEAFKAIQDAAKAEAVTKPAEAATAAVDETKIEQLIEAKLKSLGIAKVEASANPQTATATAEQLATEAAKKAKADAETKVIADTAAELKTILNGK